MRTVSKALDILDLFGVERRELRASEVARLLGLDTSTTHRMLKVLGEHGFVTKDPQTKKYLLGPAVLRLTRMRESITPVLSVYDDVLKELCEAIGETCHASLIAGEHLASVAVCDGVKNNRVHHQVGVKLEWHATASGLVCLAFSPEVFQDKILRQSFESFTDTTVTNPDALRAELHEIRKNGYCGSAGRFDSDVASLAAPIFDEVGFAKGAISVVTPISRFSDEDQSEIVAKATEAALMVTEFEAGVPAAGFPMTLSRKAPLRSTDRARQAGGTDGTIAATS